MSHDNFSTLLTSLDDLLDDKVGVIHSIREEKTSAGAPSFFRYRIKMSNTKAFCKQRNFQSSLGVATTPEKALAKAVGEGIERYCSAIYIKENLKFCSYNDANFNCLHPNEFLHYPSRYYKEKLCNWAIFNEHTKLRWSPAVDIVNAHHKIYIPAVYVYLPYIYDDSESCITQNISTGLACHMSYEDAAINAILEVVERDPFMIFWRNKLSPPRIRMDSLSDEIKSVIYQYEAANYEVTLLDITTDLSIPTVLAVLRSDVDQNPALVVSASSKLLPELAIISALEELELTRSYCMSLFQDKINIDVDYKKIRNQTDHLLFWSNKKNLHYASFLFDSRSEIDFNSMSRISYETSAASLIEIVEIFSKLNLRVMLADITTADLLNYGFHVLRAVIPQLHPLAFGYQNDQFECDRLHGVPKTLGYKNTQLLNQYIPHPFP